MLSAAHGRPDVRGSFDAHVAERGRPRIPGRSFPWLALAAAGLGCAAGGAGQPEPAESAPEPGYTRCVEPRHPMCTREWRPVCGRRAADWQTYGNACTACADPAVIGHRAGECAER